MSKNALLPGTVVNDLTIIDRDNEKEAEEAAMNKKSSEEAKLAGVSYKCRDSYYYFCKCNVCGIELELDDEEVNKYYCEHDFYQEAITNKTIINGISVLSFAYIGRNGRNYYEVIIKSTGKKDYMTSDEIKTYSVSDS